MGETVYTLGVWHERGGKEGEFIEAWKGPVNLFSQLAMLPGETAYFEVPTIEPGRVHAEEATDPERQPAREGQ